MDNQFPFLQTLKENNWKQTERKNPSAHVDLILHHVTGYNPRKEYFIKMRKGEQSGIGRKTSASSTPRMLFVGPRRGQAAFVNN